jgi:hypothetical protein
MGKAAVVWSAAEGDVAGPVEASAETVPAEGSRWSNAPIRDAIAVSI